MLQLVMLTIGVLRPFNNKSGWVYWPAIHNGTNFTEEEEDKEEEEEEEEQEQEQEEEQES